MGHSVDAPIITVLEERAAFQRQHAKWQGVVKDLAEAFSCPISEVEKALSTAARQLEHGAHIKDFIPVLAIKQVKDLLRPYQHRPPRHEQRDLKHP